MEKQIAQEFIDHRNVKETSQSITDENQTFSCRKLNTALCQLP